jgi:hypothetical protein
VTVTPVERREKNSRSGRAAETSPHRIPMFGSLSKKSSSQTQNIVPKKLEGISIAVLAVESVATTL